MRRILLAEYDPPYHINSEKKARDIADRAEVQRAAMDVLRGTVQEARVYAQGRTIHLDANLVDRVVDMILASDKRLRTLASACAEEEGA